MKKKLDTILKNLLEEKEEIIKEKVSYRIAEVFLEEDSGLYEFKTLEEFFSKRKKNSFSYRYTIENEVLPTINAIVKSSAFESTLKKMNRHDFFNYLKQKDRSLDHKRGKRESKMYETYQKIMKDEIQTIIDEYVAKLKKESASEYIQFGLKQGKNKKIWEKEKIRRLVRT